MEDEKLSYIVVSWLKPEQRDMLLGLLEGYHIRWKHHQHKARNEIHEDQETVQKARRPWRGYNRKRPKGMRSIDLLHAELMKGPMSFKTAKHIMKANGMSHNSASARLSDLVTAGLAENKNDVYVLTAEGTKANIREWVQAEGRLMRKPLREQD